MRDPVASARSVCDGTLARLEAINARLHELEKLIKTAQPKASGAVILSFSRHRPVCMGCPHPAWKRWQAHRRNKVHPWQAHRITNPLQRIPRNENNAILRALIAEALTLETSRTALVSHLSSLSKSLRFPLPKATKPDLETPDE